MTTLSARTTCSDQSSGRFFSPLFTLMMNSAFLARGLLFPCGVLTRLTSAETQFPQPGFLRYLRFWTQIFTAQPACHDLDARLDETKVLSERKNHSLDGFLCQTAKHPRGSFFYTPVVKTLRCFTEEHAKLSLSVLRTFVGLIYL